MDKQFDDMFRNHLEHVEVPAPDGVWEAVSGQIATQAAAGSAAASLKGLIIKGAATLLIGTSSYLAYRAYTPQNTQPDSLPQKTETGQSSNAPQAAQPNSGQAVAPERKNGAKPTSEPQGELRPESESGSISPSVLPQSTMPQENSAALGEVPKPEGNGSGKTDNPCLHAPRPRLGYTEIAPSVLELICHDAPASYYEPVWFINGREAGRGHSIMYTVLNQHKVTINLKHQGNKICETETGLQEIAVQGCDLENNLLIPNVFTPNADGINDPYRVLICGAEQFLLSIFDRSGRRLFSTTDPETGWDGRINGNAAQEGMYIAKVRYRFYGHQEQEKTVMLWLKGASNQ
jgi:gliding motility-associated-like protein